MTMTAGTQPAAVHDAHPRGACLPRLHGAHITPSHGERNEQRSIPEMSPMSPSTTTRPAASLFVYAAAALFAAHLATYFVPAIRDVTLTTSTILAVSLAVLLLWSVLAGRRIARMGRLAATTAQATADTAARV